MRISRLKGRRAVAPVIAELLMIAVAVSMSVIIFMWSQGFLSQTSSAVGGQQGSQNQAAQSSLSTEAAIFTSSAATPSLTVIVRNVGAVSISLGSISITGSSSNAQFKGSVILSLPTSGTISNSATGPWVVSDGTWSATPATSATYQSVAKGGAVTLTLSATGASTTGLTPGDVVNVKVTTTVGTFAQAQFTVP